MNALAPPRWLQWLIAIVVGGFFAVPLLATALFTLRDGEGFSIANWTGLFRPENAPILRPVWTGVLNSLIAAALTVALVILVLMPTMVLVALRFPRLRRAFEFVALLPISIPAIVLVVGLAPVYLQIGRTVGTGSWTLAFAYGVLVLPFAYRSLQAAIDGIDLITLTEAARTLGAGWGAVMLRVIVPNLRSGMLSASLITVAVVLGEYTIAALLNRQVLQTALVVVNRIDAFAAAIFTLLSLAFAFGLLVLIGRAGRRRTEGGSR